MAERANRSITEKMRAVLWDSKLSHTYWGDICLAAIHVSNRMPTKRNKGITPYEVFYKSIPSVTHLRRIVCIGWVFVEEEIRKNKLAARAVCCSLIGYSERSKAYRLVDIYTGKHYESRHVVFNENQTAADIRHEQPGHPSITTIATEMTLQEFKDLFSDNQEEQIIQLPPATSISLQNQFSALQDDYFTDEHEEQEDKSLEIQSDDGSSPSDNESSFTSAADQSIDNIHDISPPEDFNNDPYSQDDIFNESDLIEPLPYALKPTETDGIYIDSSGGKISLEPIENVARKDITSGPANATRRPDSKTRNAHVSSLPPKTIHNSSSRSRLTARFGQFADR